MLRFKKYSLSFIVLPVIHLVLLELFAQGSYSLYFTSLVFIAYILNSKAFFLSNKFLGLSIVYWCTLHFLYRFMEDYLYDLKIEYDWNFQLHYVSYEVSYILSVIHIFILFLLGYNKGKLT